MKTALYTLALILLASPAMAERADHDAALLQLLAGIDTLPTRADLERVADDPQLALVKVALDHTMPLYERRRATSLLSFFPDAASEAYLTLIAATSAAPRVRWMAVYTYVRRFGELKPDRVVGYARDVLKSPIPTDREAAARGLRWVPSEKATAVLESAARLESDVKVAAAIKQALEQRRAKPSKATGRGQ